MSRWMKFIKTFPYVIKYKQCKQKIMANVLSWILPYFLPLDVKILGFEYIKDLCIFYFDFCKVSNEYKKVAFGNSLSTMGFA